MGPVAMGPDLRFSETANLLCCKALSASILRLRRVGGYLQKLMRNLLLRNDAGGLTSCASGTARTRGRLAPASRRAVLIESRRRDGGGTAGGDAGAPKSRKTATLAGGRRMEPHPCSTTRYERDPPALRTRRRLPSHRRRRTRRRRCGVGRRRGPGRANGGWW
jgi:hypothetical protein